MSHLSVTVVRIPPKEKTALFLVALNKDLSFTARGIFTRIRFASEPVTLAELVKECARHGLTPIGIETTLQELLECGVLELTDLAIAKRCCEAQIAPIKENTTGGEG